MSSASPAPAATAGHRHQAQVLVERYATCMTGDWLTTLLLVAQAPAIGALCVVVWASIERDTPSLYFVMCLSAVWFGCMNACREVVKERAIVERERLFGLSLPAYIASKLAVLAALGLLQALLLQMTIEWHLALKGAFVVHTAALWGASLAGVGLGLTVSALASTQERAVGLVPLLILPQILFSSFVLPERYFSDAVRVIEKLMPVHWAFAIFEEAAAAEPSWIAMAGSLSVLLAIALTLPALAALALLRRQAIA